MHINQEVGKYGENIATKYLEKQKYKIIERNFRCKRGEIDIIAYDEINKEIVFAEVKTRTNIKYGTPKEAVEKTKQKHIKLVASYYNYIYGIYDTSSRFDVIEIFLYNNAYKINHIKSAFI